eukprot:SAG25_NODE_888_length_4924_cov_17.004560_4_plen_86_part_00
MRVLIRDSAVCQPSASRTSAPMAALSPAGERRTHSAAVEERCGAPAVRCGAPRGAGLGARRPARPALTGAPPRERGRLWREEEEE